MKELGEIKLRQKRENYDERKGTKEQQTLKPGYLCENGWCFQQDRSSINDGFELGDLENLFDESNVVAYIPNKKRIRREAKRKLKKLNITKLLEQ